MRHVDDCLTEQSMIGEGGQTNEPRVGTPPLTSWSAGSRARDEVSSSTGSEVSGEPSFREIGRKLGFGWGSKGPSGRETFSGSNWEEQESGDPRLKLDWSTPGPLKPLPPGDSGFDSDSSEDEGDVFDAISPVHVENNGAIKFKCPYYGCLRELEAARLLRHIMRRHTRGSQAYACPICDYGKIERYRVDSSTNLLFHITSAHASELMPPKRNALAPEQFLPASSNTLPPQSPHSPYTYRPSSYTHALPTLSPFPAVDPPKLSYSSSPQPSLTSHLPPYPAHLITPSLGAPQLPLPQTPDSGSLSSRMEHLLALQRKISPQGPELHSPSTTVPEPIPETWRAGIRPSLQEFIEPSTSSWKLPPGTASLSNPLNPMKPYAPAHTNPDLGTEEEDLYSSEPSEPSGSKQDMFAGFPYKPSTEKRSTAESLRLSEMLRRSPPIYGPSVIQADEPTRQDLVTALHLFIKDGPDPPSSVIDILV